MKRLPLSLFFVVTVLIGLLGRPNPVEAKIALLFLTRNDPNHADLWHNLIEDAGEKFNVYVHSVEPPAHPFFKSCRIAKIVPTSWSIHVKAWQELIRVALKDPANEKFVFISESCVPLYSLNHIYAVLTKDKDSHMAHAKPWWEGNSPRELQELNPEYRWGNSEWVVLNRRHAKVVSQDRAIIHLVSKHENDQESYFATLFAVHGCLHEVVNQSYTFVDWSHAENGGASPHSFTEVSELNDELISRAYAMGALFARKFSKDYPEKALIRMIRD